MIKQYLFSKKRKAKFDDDINVTPVVDVMLVLLIVFMVTSQSLVSHFSVNLPTTQVDNQLDSTESSSIEIAITKNNKLFLLDSPVTKSQLQTKLTALAKANKTRKVILSADSKLEYKNVINVMEIIQLCGLKKISLISKTEK